MKTHIRNKKTYTQPTAEIIKMTTNQLLAASPKADSSRETSTGNGNNSLSGNVFNGNDYDGPQRAKRENCWSTWEE